ncbi:DNA glycosylase AlkZ-like family protein [Parachitinimonas caeni]|uniref:Crosslink repair DNA glycosylase YcaQ family protein n=1 Tax=Parachitinimonas caeni TaxID=3031301 RepID=A0ABT7E199_9NEIS|nr:crosslink repair DNA glycosylase YcaQ family protein [Parachitinimonas caeni]MDK2126095.1 crosslink repair DNA glycosylase YcaQ family protein [Parachitinimonas caeni]
MTSPTLATLRRYAISRSLFTPTTLPEAIQRLGFVQADPIRAPARAQDLILRLRVKNYRDGDLERRYPKLDVEEDVLVNYGFLPRQHQQWLHPRQFEGNTRAEHHAPELAEAVLSHVLEHGPTHPRDLEAKLGSQTYANYWGGRSNATTGLLDSLHYRGQLRVVRRDKGTRVYGPAKLAHLAELGLSPEQQLAGAARLILALYAPLPEASFKQLLQMLRYGAPPIAPLAEEQVRLGQALAGRGLVGNDRIGRDSLVAATSRGYGRQHPAAGQAISPI